MVKLKSQKGITMVALITTIVLFALILSAVSYSSITSGQIKKYNSMCADIINLQDKIDMYYLNHEAKEPTEGEVIHEWETPDYRRLPVDLSKYVDFHRDKEKKLEWLGSDTSLLSDEGNTGEGNENNSNSEPAGIRNPNDGDIYYPIDEKTMHDIGNITLNLSKDTDRYWVNAKTHTVYYETGVRATETGQLIHTINPGDYVKIDDPSLKQKPIEIGAEVNYTTKLNGVTLDKWRVFYVDGDYTYLILADYLPNAAINMTKPEFSHLNTNGIYSIFITSSDTASEELDERTYLIEALSKKSNWESLLIGTLNGKSVNETTSEHVFAMGAPDIELWKNSWNTKYPNDRLYTKYYNNLVKASVIYDGWMLGLSENQSVTMIELNDKTGYHDTLYYPHTESVDSKKCSGYWLASPSAYDNPITAMLVGYLSGIGGENVNSNRAARPIIRFPNSILYQ